MKNRSSNIAKKFFHVLFYARKTTAIIALFPILVEFYRKNVANLFFSWIVSSFAHIEVFSVVSSIGVVYPYFLFFVENILCFVWEKKFSQSLSKFSISEGRISHFYVIL